MGDIDSMATARVAVRMAGDRDDPRVYLKLLDSTDSLKLDYGEWLDLVKLATAWKAAAE